MRFCGIDIARHYYYVKPFIPRRIQLLVRRSVAQWMRRSTDHVWPIDHEAGEAPAGWLGWPDQKRFAVVLTHDVESLKGQQMCRRLMQMELDAGFRSSFNFVAAGYAVSSELRHHLTAHGFEVGVHGLVHSRKLYESRKVFQRHAVQINQYLNEWNAVGFRSPCMYHNLDWLRDLDITYDSSTFDTDPFEPQPTGVKTIFPFTVDGDAERKGYVELPYTLPQDFTLFVLFREGNIDIWKRKLEWIAQKGGMALLNTHPDYMSFDHKSGSEKYPVRFYQEFLQHVAKTYRGQFWHPLPYEMARYWSLERAPSNEAVGGDTTPLLLLPVSKKPIPMPPTAGGDRC